MGKAEFIVIDDDPINNIICQKLIELALPGSRVITFTDVRPALSKLAESVASPSQKSILFLDINMPECTGWDVLEQIEHSLGAQIHTIDIYLLTTSLDREDMHLAKNHRLIAGFVSKPLTRARLQALFPAIETINPLN